MSAESEYRYFNASPTWANAYLWPVLQRQIGARFAQQPERLRALDLGCGNGATSDMLTGMGFDVTGVDTSSSGIDMARTAYPHCRFEIASAYDDLAARFGTFPLVVSLEVIEHLYDPRKFASRMFELLTPGGIGMISTPYHGYLKNVALALTGRMDKHFTALWDGGHIKFFSIDTLGKLLTEAGFDPPQVVRAGRLPPLAKSMVAIVRKPAIRTGDALQSPVI